MKRSGRTTWFLKHLGVEDAVIGDLVEQYAMATAARHLAPHATNRFDMTVRGRRASALVAAFI